MVSHDFKLFFIHIPKCAGRSISEVFNQRFDQFTANHYRLEYAWYWQAYEAFTIVRNPYDRYVSMYHYILNHRRHKLDPVGGGGANPDFKTWLLQNIYSFRRSFRQNSPEGERGTDFVLGSPHWFSSQVRTIEDYHGNFDDVKIFRYEHGFDQIKDYLRSKGVPVVSIPHLNKTQHGDYREYYDEGLLKSINKFRPLLDDCERLGYELLEEKKAIAV